MGRIRKGRVVCRGGRQYARLRWVDDDGKEYDKWYRGATRTDANTILEAKLSELRTRGGESLTSESTTFEKYAREFEKTYLVPAIIKNGIKVMGLRSLSTVKGQVRTLIDFFGRKKLRALKYSDLERFRDERLNTPVTYTRKTSDGEVTTERPRAVATVNRELALLRKVLNTAKRDGLILDSPFSRGTGVISTASEVARDRVLSHAEESDLLAACHMEDKQGREDRYVHLQPIIITAIETAMRLGEILGLERRDVDLEGGVICVRSENSKTMKTRIVPVTLRLRAELEKVMVQLPDSPRQRLFPVSCIRKGFWAVCRKAGIREFRFHDLRHSGISRLIAAGVPAPEVMKISGHSQVSTFLKYLNPKAEAMKRAADLLTAFNESQTALVQAKGAPVQVSETVN
jgi:integrase